MLKSELNFYINKLKQGKKEYFPDFYKMTKNAVFYTAMKIIRSRELAEDIMQETYISFLNNLCNIDEDKNYYAYLITIARNKAINQIKKDVNVVYPEDIEIYPAKEKKDMPLLELCRAKMTPQEFELLELCVVMQYRRVEIAKIKGIPIATLNWQYNQVVKKAKLLYKEAYDER